MSKKHVEQYYEEICNQYHEFILELKDFEDLCNKGMVAPEVIEMAKKTIAPLKDNWRKLGYVMYLLNMPNKKSKQDGYKNRTKLNSEWITDKEVFEQNNDCINNLNKLKG